MRAKEFLCDGPLPRSVAGFLILLLLATALGGCAGDETRKDPAPAAYGGPPPGGQVPPPGGGGGGGGGGGAGGGAVPPMPSPYGPPPIPAGAFSLSFVPSSEARQRYLIPVHVYTTSDRSAWERTDVTDYWTRSPAGARAFKFGQAPGTSGSATLRVPFQEGHKHVVVIADLPGRFDGGTGSADPRMAIIDLQMDYNFSDPQNPVPPVTRPINVTVDVNGLSVR